VFYDLFDDLVLTYILNEQGEPEPCRDTTRYALWHETDERRKVRQQRWTNAGGCEIFVSTVFLGIDHGWDGGPPVLWETMAWHGDDEPLTWRYRSRDAAIAGHARVVIELGGIPLDEPAPAEFSHKNA
jgi:hypothetical protein